jgi:glycosyltransferase involved in cell wall biosynthesis
MTTLEYPPAPGGVGESVKRIAHFFVAMGCEVHVLVFHTRQSKEILSTGGKRGLESTIDGGVHVHRSRAVVRSEENALPELLSDVAMELRLLHRRIGFDVFHAFFLNETAFVTTLVGCELGVPVINSVRGADLHKNIFNGRQFTHAMWSLESSSWITFVSRELERRAHVLAPSVLARTSAFWNSITPVDYGALPQPSLPPGYLSGLVIGAVGRFRDKKGIDYLIDACTILSKEVELTLLLVGDFVDKEKQYWQKFVQDSPLADRIRITGMVSREQALAYYPLMDIFAVPSIRDGCPNAMLEAMLSARPIIGSRVDAIGEVIEDRVCGRLVDPASVDQLVSVLRELAFDPSTRHSLGKAARKKALESLTPEVECANWVRVYERVLATRRMASEQRRIHAYRLP